MSILWLNKPRKFIISHIRAKPISPHGKVPIPNNEDYNIDSNTYDGEFFQEDGLEGHFEIDLTGVIEMKVHDDEMVDDQDAGEEVCNAKDLELLQRLQLGDGNEDEIPPLEHRLELLDLCDSDDETYDPANPDEDDYF